MDHEDGADKKFKEVLLLLEGVVDEISNFHVWVVLVFSSGSKFVSVYRVVCFECWIVFIFMLLSVMY